MKFPYISNSNFYYIVPILVFRNGGYVLGVSDEFVIQPKTFENNVLKDFMGIDIDRSQRYVPVFRKKRSSRSMYAIYDRQIMLVQMNHAFKNSKNVTV